MDPATIDCCLFQKILDLQCKTCQKTCSWDRNCLQVSNKECPPGIIWAGGCWGQQPISVSKQISQSYISRCHISMTWLCSSDLCYKWYYIFNYISYLILHHILYIVLKIHILLYILLYILVEIELHFVLYMILYTIYLMYIVIYIISYIIMYIVYHILPTSAPASTPT